MGFVFRFELPSGSDKVTCDLEFKCCLNLRLGRLVKPLTNSEQSNVDGAVQMKKSHTSLGERTYDVERNNFWENQTSKAKQSQMNQ